MLKSKPNVEFAYGNCFDMHVKVRASHGSLLNQEALPWSDQGWALALLPIAESYNLGKTEAVSNNSATWCWRVKSKNLHTSARNISNAKPLKQLITACWMSRPRLSIARRVDSRIPGLRPQNMWMLTARPSLSLTSTYAYHQTTHNIQHGVHHSSYQKSTFAAYEYRWSERSFKYFTLAGCPVGLDMGLANALGQSSSLIRAGSPGVVGVNG